METGARPSVTFLTPVAARVAFCYSVLEVRILSLCDFERSVDVLRSCGDVVY